MLTPHTLVPQLKAAANSLALAPQDFGSQGVTRPLTAYLHRAVELVEAAGRADPEPAVALVRLLSCLDPPHGAPAAAHFVDIFTRAANVVENAAYTVDTISPELVVTYYEAAASMRLPVHVYLCWDKSGIQLLLRSQLQASTVTPSQVMRLLRAWVALVQATSSGTFCWRPAQVDLACSCLRPGQLSPVELEGAIRALGALSCSSWGIFAGIKALSLAIISRWVAQPSSYALSVCDLRLAAERHG